MNYFCAPMMKKALTLFILGFLLNSLAAQITLLEEYPFKSGEIGTYDAIYEWGFIEIRAGEVQFEIQTLVEGSDSLFHFKSIGNSKSKYDWIYTVRDTFQSTVFTQQFIPKYYQRKTSEGNYSVFNEIYFNHDQNIIYMELSNSEKGSQSKTMAYKEGIYDLQTAVYYARVLNFENAFMGEEYKFNVIIDGVLYEIPIRYEGKEMIRLSDEISYNCYRISTQVIEGTIFKSNQTIKIWVSDDGRQIPIKVEAPIKVGMIKAELTNYIQGYGITF